MIEAERIESSGSGPTDGDARTPGVAMAMSEGRHGGGKREASLMAVTATES